MCAYAIKSQHHDTIAALCNSDNGNDNRNSTQSENLKDYTTKHFEKMVACFQGNDNSEIYEYFSED